MSPIPSSAYSASRSRFEPALKRFCFGGRETQPQFRAAPEDVFGGLCPLLVHEITDFGFIEIGTKMSAHVVEPFGFAQDFQRARTVARGEPFEMTLGKKRVE